MMIRFTIDPTKRGNMAEIRVEPPYEVVGLLIDSDLRSAYNARGQLTELREIVAGTRVPSETTGNGFAVMPGRESTHIESMYSDLSVEVPTADLIHVLEQWLAYVLETYGDNSPKPMR